ncbi:MAG: TIGR03936 family radical SAM-associated protein [Sciscionella sp.]
MAFRLRLRYAKRGRLRFTSHRDIARAFERSLRRVGAPMAFSQGFSPHPRISWVGAAPTGVASEAEYVELGLTREVDPDELSQRLSEALPDGLDVLEAVPAGPGALAERIDASGWRIELEGVDPAELADAVRRLLERDVVEVERLTKDGRRIIDIRPAVVSLQVEAPQPGGIGVGPTRSRADVPSGPPLCGILMAVVRQMPPTVRPDDVLSALRVVAALRPPVPVKATRMAQGRLDDEGRLADPLAPDRATASSAATGKRKPG